MRILVIGPEFLEVEKYLKKIVCTDGKAVLTVHKKKQMKPMIDELIEYVGDDSLYNYDISYTNPKRVTISYKD
jgi:hypothetical protein